MNTDKNKRLFQVTAEDFKKIPGNVLTTSSSSIALRDGGTPSVLGTGVIPMDIDKYLLFR